MNFKKNSIYDNISNIKLPNKLIQNNKTNLLVKITN